MAEAPPAVSTPPATGAPPAGTPVTGTAPAGTAPAGTPPGAAPVVTTTGPGTPAAAAPPISPPAGKWPESWREDYAKGDEKKMARLQRYAGPEAAIDAMISAQNRISSGDLRSILPQGAAPEVVAAWRAENGIPEKAEDYKIDLGNGQMIGDEDKPIIDDFLKYAHASNMHPEQAKTAVQWYYQHQEQLSEEQAQKDTEIAQKGSDTLHAEWGREYRQNLNRFSAAMDSMFTPEVKDLMLSGRLADGTPLGSHVDFIKAMVALSYERNPGVTLVPPGGGDMASSINDEMGKLEKMMGDKNSEYWKGPSSEGNQERYRKLIDARDAHKNRGAAGR